MAQRHCNRSKRYAKDPLIKALLLSLTGIGGSAIVDALNYAKF
ncbi:hypothetical protein [Pseudomonas mandelii]|nr:MULTISPECIES: hypothetical protein [Pseudomonas]